ncbi:MAG: Gfo/Idh/MocA family protein [Rubricella sp.]
MAFTVGLIGAGYFASYHADAWARIPGAHLAAVADRDKAKAAALGPAFTDADDMMARVCPDIVDIATPSSTHLAMIHAALARRPRAIICQKPFCADLHEAEHAANLAADADVPLIVHENFRFQPWYRTLKRLIAGGSLGHVHQLHFRFRTGDGRGADAYSARQPYFREMPRFLIHETGIHWIDTFRFLLGEPQAISADLRRINPVIAGEDAGSFTFHYASGTRATFDGDRTLDAGAKDPRLTFGTLLLEAEAASIRLDTDGSLHRRAFGGRDWIEIGAPVAAQGFAGDCVHALQSHVVSALAGKGSLENTARAYLRNLVLEEAIYAANRTRRTVRL